MAERLLEIYVPKEHRESVEDIVNECQTLGLWRENVGDRIFHLQVLISSEESEQVLDLLQKSLATVEGFRIVILPVEATIPQRKEPAKEEVTPEKPAKKNPLKPKISREELYEDIQQASDFTAVYIALVILSAFVATVGLVRDSIAVIIGAMVIAPLLGPNVGLSLATTLSDAELGKKAFISSISGIGIVLIIAFGLGHIVEFEIANAEIISRTEVAFSDLIVALASGAVGALAYTTGIPTMLVGVTVAVALLPPLVVLGLLLGAGHYDLALGSFLLLLANLICINLAGVITFVVQGIRPLSWWEASRAKKLAHRAIASWIVLLSILVFVILLAER